MQHHTSSTLVCDRSDTPQLLITRLYELCPTTLPDEMTSRLLTPVVVVVKAYTIPEAKNVEGGRAVRGPRLLLKSEVPLRGQ